ncbi:MAG: 50S ribosomal protein L37ae [Candidatus Micrarchaeota archaeon]
MRSSKFGAKNRKKIDAALKTKNALYECRDCGKKKVRRKSFSQWECRSCGKRYAGGAYTLKTDAGTVAERLIGEYHKTG